MMTRRVSRLLLILLEGFLALTAIGGGIGLITGLLAMPVAYLSGSIFTSFLIPGLSLMVVVGGLAVVGAVLVAKRHRFAPAATAVSGLAIIFFEVVEVMVIGSPVGVARNLQVFYLGLGLLILVASLPPLAQLRHGPART
ncbi:MAG: hypothetical protein WBZ24_01390 [Anaerolineales bacterium]|jgi:hypothetical protein